MASLTRSLAPGLALAILLGHAATALADVPFYKGKRLTLLINFAAGGPTDIEGRLFARYLVKHIDEAGRKLLQVIADSRQYPDQTEIVQSVRAAR